MSTRVTSLLLALVLGCAGTTEASQTPEVRAAPSEPTASVSPSVRAEEQALVSVRPHVNDRYMEPDAVATWTDKLERERREVIAQRDAIVDALELEPGMVVADIGAGTGAFLQALSGELGEQGKLYAVDIAPQFVEHLRERASSNGLDNVEVIEGSVTETRLPSDSVDLLFLCDVYHHLEYPSAYLRSLHQTLRPDGRMVIVEFEKIPGKTSPAMMKHVRQDKETLLAEVAAEGFVLEREVESVALEENYMLVFRKAAPALAVAPAPAPAPAPAIVPAPAQPLEVDPANYRMVLAGNIVIGLGGAGLAAMLTGLVIRGDAVAQRKAASASINPDTAAIARQQQRIETGNIVAITGGATAGVLFATGITLVAVGYARERKRREASSSTNVTFVPLLGRDHVGLGGILRF